MLKCDASALFCEEQDPTKLTVTDDGVYCATHLKMRDQGWVLNVKFPLTEMLRKQSTQGTTVNPVIFPRWLDGSSLTIGSAWENPELLKIRE